VGTEHFSWREHRWHAANKDWRRAKVITAGVDVGSSASKAVVMADGELLAYSILWSGADNRDSAWKALEAALNGIGMSRENIHYIVGTGCGETDVSEAKRTVSEFACHAKGADYCFGPAQRTVLALGGRGCTVIHCNREGRVTAFLTNASEPGYCRENPCNACGAAQGRGLEVVADYLGVPIEDIGRISLKVADKQLKERLALPLDKRARVEDKILEEINKEPVTGGHLLDGGSPPLGGALSVVCDVLAKSQASALLQNGWSKEEVLAIHSAALAHQAAMLVGRLGIVGDLAVAGGVAKNIGVVRRLEKELGVKSVALKPDPQLSAALGAAVLAEDFVKKAGRAT
jgi:activator of 2-hydroxyglutaryl-CoA dehydratase